MGFDKRIGIGIGIGAVAVIALIIVAYNSQTYDDARLANLIATYFEDVDRLSVAVILHNADGEFTKANGHLELTIEKNGHQVYSNEYDFTKNDFLTWENIFLGKQRGILITIDERFSRGDYDVYANLETKSSNWEGLHTTFYSFEFDQQDTIQPIPEPAEQVIIEPTPEPTSEPTPDPSTQTQQPSCDTSYPDLCIPSPPPDLNCSDIPQKRFTVLQPDPHRFDGNKDGIGCES